MGETKLDNYITLEEAVERFKGAITINTLRRRIKMKELKAYKPGKRVLLNVVELETFVRRAAK